MDSDGWGEKQRERKAGVEGGREGVSADPRKRIRFVECQLEEGSRSRDLNTGSIIVN